MTILKYNPLREMVAYQNRINKHFYDSPALYQSNCFSPNIDMVEQDEKIIIEAEIPGVNKSDLKITLQDNILTIEGEKKKVNDADNKKYFRSERNFGSFKRCFRLPNDINRENVDAKYENGILNVVISKEEPKQPEERDVLVK